MSLDARWTWSDAGNRARVTMLDSEVSSTATVRGSQLNPQIFRYISAGSVVKVAIIVDITISEDTVSQLPWSTRFNWLDNEMYGLES
jgi:hypothetical protein